MLKLLSHLRYAARQFRGSPVFTAASVLTLALGIGGTTAKFTLMDAVMLRSLPVSNPGKLLAVEHRARGNYDPFYRAQSFVKTIRLRLRVYSGHATPPP